jgi:hypothetical protein
VDRVGVCAWRGTEIVARGVEVRRSRGQGFLLDPNNRERWRRQRGLFMTTVAPRTVAGDRSGRPAGGILRFGLVLQGRSLVVDVATARRLYGGRAATKACRDQIWQESLRRCWNPSRRLPCHDARSTDVETPRKEILIAAPVNCKALEEKVRHVQKSLETGKARTTSRRALAFRSNYTIKPNAQSVGSLLPIEECHVCSPASVGDFGL